MHSKENKAIKFLQNIADGQTLNVAFSAGKDSVVILDLAKRAGIKYKATYSNTTIDPPGTMGFIRKHYPEVEILQPPKSFYQLVINKGLPTRKGRFCCEHLKERAGIGQRNIDGTRWQESAQRKKYTFEDCDTRKWMKGAVHIRPILDWTTNEVWAYIWHYKLAYIKYYDPPYNFKRHGCIGCPYGGPKQMLREFQLFPKHAKAILKAIRKHMAKYPHRTFGKNFSNEYEVFYWWLSGLSIKNYLILRDTSLFPIVDFKKLIEDKLFHHVQH